MLCPVCQKLIESKSYRKGRVQLSGNKVNNNKINWFSVIVLGYTPTIVLWDRHSPVPLFLLLQYSFISAARLDYQLND